MNAEQASKKVMREPIRLAIGEGRRRWGREQREGHRQKKVAETDRPLLNNAPHLDSTVAVIDTETSHESPHQGDSSQTSPAGKDLGFCASAFRPLACSDQLFV